MRENYYKNNSEIDKPISNHNNELQDTNKTKIIPPEKVDDIEKKQNFMTAWINISINIMVFNF